MLSYIYKYILIPLVLLSGLLIIVNIGNESKKKIKYKKFDVPNYL